MSAQAKTTERSQINVEQQLRWHYLIENERDYLWNKNLPNLEFIAIQEHFQLNLYETCLRCNEGVLKIVGDKKKGKERHNKNVSDNRVSITVVKCGNAAGSNGPVIFVGVGQNENLDCLFVPRQSTKY